MRAGRSTCCRCNSTASHRDISTNYIAAVTNAPLFSGGPLPSAEAVVAWAYVAFSATPIEGASGPQTVGIAARHETVFVDAADVALRLAHLAAGHALALVDDLTRGAAVGLQRAGAAVAGDV